MNENFLKAVKQLNEVADYFIDEEGNRSPLCIMVRAMRTVVNPDAKECFNDSSKEELINDVVETTLSFLLEYNIDYKWFVSRNCCIPELTKDEINRLKSEIEIIKKNL